MLTRRQATLGCLCLSCGTGAAAARIRIATQRTGTFAWELAVMKDRGFDQDASLSLETTAFATEEASKVALLSGATDVIVSDLVWAAGQRALGADFMYVPFSTMIGAVVVPAASSIQSVEALRGRRIGVAGGSLDKNFILLRIFAARHGLDMRRETTLAFAAPPLLNEKMLQGELDAVLTYWNFAAGLRLRAHRSLLEMTDVEQALGATAPVAFLGYVFRRALAQQNGDALDRFLAACRRARRVLASDSASWDRINARLGITNDADLLALYRTLYLSGSPSESPDARADARLMLDLIAKEGGLRLTHEGLFYDEARG